jgi:hypothetical protein
VAVRLWSTVVAPWLVITFVVGLRLTVRLSVVGLRLKVVSMISLGTSHNRRWLLLGNLLLCLNHRLLLVRAWFRFISLLFVGLAWVVIIFVSV